MFENSGTRRQSLRHCNTRRPAGPYKRRALRAWADRERERPRATLVPSAPLRKGPRQEDARSPLAAPAPRLLATRPTALHRTRCPDAHRCVGVFASALARASPARHNELPHGQDDRRRRHPPPLGQAGEFFCHRFRVRSPSRFSFSQIAHGSKKIKLKSLGSVLGVALSLSPP